MEIGFIIIMLCLVMMASTFIYLVYTHRNRSCKSCKFSGLQQTVSTAEHATASAIIAFTGNAVGNGNVKLPKRMNFKIIHLWAITSNKT